MKLYWKKQNPGDFNHEAIWGGIAFLALSATYFLPLDKMSLTVCWFHKLSGLPCPSCGGTRAFVALANGNWTEGFLLNPGATILFILLILFIPYALWVVIARKRRLRITSASPRERMALISAFSLLILANWIYLVWAGR